MKSALSITFALSFLAVLGTTMSASLRNHKLPEAPAASHSTGIFLASDGADNVERWHKRQA
ncbi:hypothetical protein [Pseudomonas sp. S09G 359]|jgi:hypothetical protein|uniref:hypothetical protein n=1 Tax=Pseudomonas sp. S09G 359 TaxID=2054919 RepID=UPI0012FEA9B6|nr:hypothetical protein [Pseudomonas sp. S09G 359]